jgi:hypothetical protein
MRIILVRPPPPYFTYRTDVLFPTLRSTVVPKIPNTAHTVVQPLHSAHY